jgi:hypothetical protein
MTAIRYGRLITRRRARLIRDYKHRRGQLGFVRLSLVKDYDEWRSYDVWVRGFEGFMLHGFGQATEGRATERVSRQAVRMAVQDDARNTQAGQGDV